MLSKAKRQRVRDRWGNKCFYCWSTETLTVDHIVPLSRGGTNEDENLLLACKVCNNAKGSMSMEEFLVFRQERMGRRPRKASALTLRRKLERTPLVEFRKRKKEQE